MDENYLKVYILSLQVIVSFKIFLHFQQFKFVFLARYNVFMIIVRLNETAQYLNLPYPRLPRFSSIARQIYSESTFAIPNTSSLCLIVQLGEDLQTACTHLFIPLS